MANQAISVMQYDVLVSLRYIPHACLLTTGFCIVIIALLYWFFGTEIGASVRATPDVIQTWQEHRESIQMQQKC